MRERILIALNPMYMPRLRVEKAENALSIRSRAGR